MEKCIKMRRQDLLWGKEWRIRSFSSHLSSVFTFNEVLNLAINAWSLHTYRSEHRIPHGCVGTPARFTERSPHLCTTTNLTDHHSKTNREATCSRRHCFYHACLQNKVSHWDFLSNLISVYPPSLEALRIASPLSLLACHTRLCFLFSHSILLPFRPLSLRQTPPKIAELVLNDYLRSDISATVTDYERLAPLLARYSEL